MVHEDEVYIFGLMGNIEWALAASDPNEVSLQPHANWAVVTPLGLLRAGLDPEQHGPKTRFIGLVQGKVWASTEALCLRRLGDNDERRPEPITALPLPFLKHLRHMTGQASIPRRVAIAFPIKCGRYDNDLPEFGPDATTLGFTTRDYMIATRLTADHLRSLSVLPRDHVPPIHEDFLLDALEAQIEADHRKAILYAAVAMESAATLYLDNEYERVRQLGPTSQSYRITSTQVTATSTTVADPVYDALSKMNGFRYLLHERPLYLTKRSLLLDDPNTYRDALALYEARNKTAHGSVPSEETNYTPPNRDAAVRALDVSIRVIRWFGFDANYPVWRDMIKVDGTATLP